MTCRCSAKRWLRSAFGVFSVFIAMSCGGETADSRPQWTVVLSTDMPVPQFGDRLLVEILDDTGEVACTGCRRQLGVGNPSAWPLSFGLVPSSSGRPLRLRARLYRMMRTDSDGLPEGTLFIDAYAKLSPTDQAVVVNMPLAMSCFGVPANVQQEQSCDPATGQLGPAPTLTQEGEVLQVGAWGPAQPKPCEGEVPDDMVCVPGGVFLLGSTDELAGQQLLSATDERLISLSPFAMDREEVTVGQLRALIVEGKVTAEPAQRASDPTGRYALCNWAGSGDPTFDDMPANCMNFLTASAACQTMGKRLPTESEWEYAAGNLSGETKYPWGNDGRDLCEKVIVARGRSALEALQDEDPWCRGVLGDGTTPPGPVAGGSDVDITSLGIRNLAGNVSEWTSDAFAQYGTGCWGASDAVLADPVCAPVPLDQDPSMSIRGGNFANGQYDAVVTIRKSATQNSRFAQLGFRCVKSM